MDWPNERYVRLFTRNTTTWRRLLWDGQCMLLHLLRVVDRAGVLDIQDMEPAEACAMHTGAPPDVAERGVSKMLALGVIVHEGTRLRFPNFLEAQECPMSDKQRAKVSREKRASQNVTPESLDVTVKSQSVTQPSRGVTSRHSSSFPSRSSSLSSSENSLNLSTTAASSNARESGGGCVEVGDPIRAQASRGRARLNAIPPGLGLDFDHGGKWQAPLATISRYPEADWAIAATTLARVVADSKTRGFVTPQHIVDYWALYSAGQTPGGKSADRGGRPANYQGPKVSRGTLERAYAERKDARAALAKCSDPSERYTVECKLAELEARIPRLEAAE